MIVLYVRVCVTVLMLLGLSQAENKTKCEVVQALRAQRVPDYDLRNWLCLVDQESSYEYDLIKYNDFGIFQLNRDVWCNKTNGYPGTTCWKLNTYGCLDLCNSFLDADISNDANCAVRIRNCDGFQPWFGWRDRCHDVSGPEYDYTDC
ncbi:lysozyme-like [Mercenaria mercenaria]|uniref:lysozyme-like n=1 Tax=Mercenaria mercenaria TaxID=6596 RepID=UPI00234F0425|nr:lysozyme-like [Mercenaria mercenaria]XP_053397436.1 lysozyme-like [Mercenaria mercenaria]XP_053397437.1 lysozyme-like [Mercenaria mercenaria]XP_053397438.1 lysozyme-like [Mercenaria mercenaria]